MTGVAKGLALGLAAVAAAVMVAVAFLWLGPGRERYLDTASASVLFDEQVVIDVYERVSPSVVEVSTSRGGEDLWETGVGSGFLIDSQGHIVTNNHVVEGAAGARVRFSDGTSAEAAILGRNPAGDQALLKVDPSVVSGKTPVELGDSSELKPGQMAIAIGNPFGLEGSVTVGVISQLGRDLPSSVGRLIPNVIQTDALISPGSSGGPLLDSSGAVVGINTAIRLSPLGERTMGFAVPVDDLKEVLPDLKAGEVIRSPWLGIRVADVDSDLAQRLDLNVERGVYVTGVTEDSPAGDAGLVESGTGSRGAPASGGDVITAVDGVSVDNTAELIAELNASRPQDQVTLTVVRDGETLEIQVTLGEWPEAAETRSGRWIQPHPDFDGRGPSWDRFHFRWPDLDGPDLDGPDLDGMKERVPEEFLERFLCKEEADEGTRWKICREPSGE